VKKRFLLLILLGLGLDCYSQIKFELGYFIKNSGERIDCLIKNSDWKDNPTEFDYKLLESEKVETQYISNVTEFYILNTPNRFYKISVDIDESRNNIEDLDNIKEPRFVNKEIFLKPLIEGEATLYSYESKEDLKFFYKVGDSKVQQLVYKKYNVNNRIRENVQYRSQLWSDLKCESILHDDVGSIPYKAQSLNELFIKYNRCTQTDFHIYNDKNGRDLFNLSLRPGVSLASLKIENSDVNGRDVDFGMDVEFRFGLEVEYIMPFNKNKWSLVFEPTYKVFKTSKDLPPLSNPFSGLPVFVEVSYSSIEIPVGIRYYSFINDQSKVFANLLYLSELGLDSKVIFEATNGNRSSLDISSNGAISFGLGYNYDNKAGVELRYRSSNVLNRYVSWTSNYDTISLILSYSIF